MTVEAFVGMAVVGVLVGLVGVAVGYFACNVVYQLKDSGVEREREHPGIHDFRRKEDYAPKDFTGRVFRDARGFNKKLAQVRGLSDHRVDMIKAFHSMREHLFDISEKIDLEDPKEIEAINRTLMHLEFTLQAMWDWEKDFDYHSWWYQLPGCTCSHAENEGMLGVPNRTVRIDCPFHGVTEEADPKREQIA